MKSSEASDSSDYLRRPLRSVWLWGVPLAALVAINLLAVPPAVKAGILIAAFAWIGVACLANAVHCGRVHCWFTGPWCVLTALLLLGDAVFGIRIPGLTFSLLANIGGLGALFLWFVPELILGKYFKSRASPKGQGDRQQQGPR